MNFKESEANAIQILKRSKQKLHNLKVLSANQTVTNTKPPAKETAKFKPSKMISSDEYDRVMPFLNIEF